VKGYKSPFREGAKSASPTKRKQKKKKVISKQNVDSNSKYSKEISAYAEEGGSSYIYDMSPASRGGPYIQDNPSFSREHSRYSEADRAIEELERKKMAKYEELARLENEISSLRAQGFEES